MPKQVVIPPGTGKPLAPYVPGTLADGVLYVSGTLPLDAEANVVHVGDAAAQTRHVLETIKGVVEAAGGTMDDVTFTHVFLADWADYAVAIRAAGESCLSFVNPCAAQPQVTPCLGQPPGSSCAAQPQVNPCAGQQPGKPNDRQKGGVGDAVGQRGLLGLAHEGFRAARASRDQT